MPDPLVIAIFLTMISFGAVLFFTDFSAGQAVDAWGGSYWSLLRFTAQMILILALGHVVAHTRPVQRLLVAVASLVHSARMAYIGITLFAGLAALLSWGSPFCHAPSALPFSHAWSRQQNRVPWWASCTI